MDVTFNKLKSLDTDKRKQLFNIQRHYISIETKLMFERDRNTKRQLLDQLKDLDKQRKEIIKADA